MTNRAGKRLLRGAILGLAIAALLLTFASGPAAAQPPLARDFFGTVVSVEGDVVLVSTTDAVVEVLTSGETEVRVPLKREASVKDLKPGDTVAVSMEERDGSLVADKIFVVPSKTQHRHIPGEVVSIFHSRITMLTIRPLGSEGDTLTFEISPDTKFGFHHGTAQLKEGTFVVVLTTRHPYEGDILPYALEVHAVSDTAPAYRASQLVPQNVEPETYTTARIQGVFEGVDDEGNLVVNGIAVQVGPRTRVQSGLAVGRTVKVQGELRADGSVLASDIEVKEDGSQIFDRTRLEGIFEGVDKDGGWLVSGTPVTLIRGADTDGLPLTGQRVRIVAVVGEDGRIEAREVENKPDIVDIQKKNIETRLEGSFWGVSEDGHWVVSGLSISVDKSTKLIGAPAIGSYMDVRAVRTQDGPLLARKIEVERRLDQSINPKEQVEVKAIIELRGPIQDLVLNGDGRVVSLEINGHRVAISQLTEIGGTLGAETVVTVEAVLLRDGSLIAREVDATPRGGRSGAATPDNVEIRGAIKRLNEGNSLLLVNGLKVSYGPESRINGGLTVGATIKIEGTLQPDGSIFARTISVEGATSTSSRTEQHIEGVIDALIVKNGQVVGVIVNGRIVNVDALTKAEAVLRPGASVRITGIAGDQGLLAKEIVSGPQVGQAGSGQQEQVSPLQALRRLIPLR